MRYLFLKISILFAILLFGCSANPHPAASSILSFPTIIDCGQTEKSMYASQEKPAQSPPFRITIDSRADDKTIKAINEAISDWNLVLNRKVFSFQDGISEVHISTMDPPSAAFGPPPIFAIIYGSIALDPKKGFWKHEFGHVLGLLHPWGGGETYTPTQWESLDSCTKQSIMASIVGFFTKDAILKIKTNFGF